MNLRKKKKIAKKTFGVGEKRIVFVESRLEDIGNAITKQDMRDLKESGAILIKEIKGRRAKSRKKSRSVGNVRKKVRTRKRDYINLTRKLRKHIRSAHSSGKVSKEELGEIRRKIRNKEFRSRSHLNEHLSSRGGTK